MLLYDIPYIILSYFSYSNLYLKLFKAILLYVIISYFILTIIIYNKIITNSRNITYNN